ncbi:MAG: hypothetical protein OXC63_14190 [Aestuariivita sp.]|nr:hypothetical protein [Aestuariivita sp.]
MTEPLSVVPNIRPAPDLPAPAALIVKDHIAPICVCPTGQGTTPAAFPGGIKATMTCDPIVPSLAVYLNTDQNPFRRNGCSKPPVNSLLSRCPTEQLSTWSRSVPIPIRRFPTRCVERSQRRRYRDL